MSASEKTWNPPLSVRIGPGQAMNRCRSPRSRDDLLAGAEHQVIGVGEDDLRPGGGDVVGQDALDRPLRADGHERGRVEDAVARGDAAEARVGGGVAGEQFVTEGGSGGWASACPLVGTATRLLK